MERYRAEDLIHKINAADEKRLHEIGESVSMSNTHPKVAGILFKAIEVRREHLRSGLLDPLVVHAEVELDDE